MYQSVWCMWITCATAVALWSRHVSVVSSFGKASERAGSNVFPLISQVGARPFEIVNSQVRCGCGLAAATHSGSGRSVAGTPRGSTAPGLPTRNSSSGPSWVFDAIPPL